MIGTLVDERYELISELGEGGMATVYQAIDKRLSREVAIKILHPHIAKHEEFCQRFQQEAAIAARLIHPNIVQIYDYGRSADGRTFIVSELVRGQDLHNLQQHRLKRYAKPFPPVFSLMVCEEILKALTLAHSQNFIHRDVKPDNVIVSEDGSIKLTDFGIAKNLDSSMTVVGHFLGSPVYSSPEQVQGSDVDARSDLFSVGVILYEAITGKLPFTGQTASEVMMKIIQGKPTPIEFLTPEIHPDVKRIVERALSKEKDDRFPSAKDMGEWIRTFLNQIDIENSRSGLELYVQNPDEFVSKHSIMPHRVNASTHSEQIKAQHNTKTLDHQNIYETRRKQNTRKDAMDSLKTTLQPISKMIHNQTRSRLATIRKTAPRNSGNKSFLPWLAFVTIVAVLAIVAIVASDKSASKSQSFNRIAPSNTRQPINAPELPPVSAVRPDSKPPKQIPDLTPPAPTGAPTNAPNTFDTRKTAQTIRTPLPAKKTPDSRVAITTNSRPQIPNILQPPQAPQTPDGVKTNKLQSTKLSFQTIPGELNFSIDGKVIGKSNADGTMTPLDIKPGPHALTIAATEHNGVRYAQFDRRVYVEQNKVTNIGIIRLTPIRTLTLNITGPGVVVRVNGDPFTMNGKPITLNLPEGKVEIKARSSSGKTYEKTINLKGDNLTLNTTLE